jgi:hypothetical protein
MLLYHRPVQVAVVVVAPDLLVMEAVPMVFMLDREVMVVQGLPEETITEPDFRDPHLEAEAVAVEMALRLLFNLAVVEEKGK